LHLIWIQKVKFPAKTNHVPATDQTLHSGKTTTSIKKEIARPLRDLCFKQGNSFQLKPGLFRLFLSLIGVMHHSFPIRLGGWAVGILFVLSGYWIARMWVE
jgi:hypothetical protein